MDILSQEYGRLKGMRKLEWKANVGMVDVSVWLCMLMYVYCDKARYGSILAKNCCSKIYLHTSFQSGYSHECIVVNSVTLCLWLAAVLKVAFLHQQIEIDCGEQRISVTVSPIRAVLIYQFQFESKPFTCFVWHAVS